MTINYIHDTQKLANKKHNYAPNNLALKETEEVINVLSNFRANIYKRIYKLIKSPVKKWRTFDFLSDNSKIESFIEKIEKEIKVVKESNFDFYKYRDAIIYILGKDVNKYNDTIIKNMYIAKLQNIVFLLKEANDGDEMEEVKSSNKDISR